MQRKLLNKVPEITLYFWIIKILCTTVGETAADYLNATLGFGLTNTTYVMTAILAVVLIGQFKAKRYVPGIYWTVVALLSVVGTLITDNLTDNFGISLLASTAIFGLALLITFGTWYGQEKTLSVHSILTPRREAFYWLTILFTFALGTASGDLISEQLNLGYPLSVIIFATVIGVITFAHLKLRLNAILSFWLAYILTRPLGASIGDLLSQSKADGGLGLGTTLTSILFLLAIMGLVVYLTLTKRDAIPSQKNHWIS